MGRANGTAVGSRAVNSKATAAKAKLVDERKLAEDKQLAQEEKQVQTGSDVIRSKSDPLAPDSKDPLGHYGIDRYASYRNRPGDHLAGHEMLQNFWLKLKGFGKRLTSTASKDNPAVGLTWTEHKRVGREQVAMKLFDEDVVGKMSTLENIEQNAEAMRRAGIPEGVISAHRDAAIRHGQSLGVIPPNVRSSAPTLDLDISH